MTQDITLIFLYFVLFIFQNEDATGAAVRKSHDEGGTDARDKCLRCVGLPKKLEKEQRRSFTKENKSKYFQKLNDNFYKYKYLGKPAFSNGWGGAGMPFNVLYTPNAYQQKILKSVPGGGRPTGRYSHPMKGVPETYNLVLEDDNQPRGKAKESWTKKQKNSPRKYYSLIPQLFVSYGW